MPRERTKFTKIRPQSPDAIDQPWRLFTAISLGPEHQAKIEELLAIARATPLPVRWIGASAAHLTLHFMGDVPPEQGELLRMAFPTAAAGCRPFVLNADGAGAFPSLNKPQVIWIGLRGELSRLRRLHEATGAFLSAYGFAAEDEEAEFKPHITIGRARGTLQTPDINGIHALMRSKPVKAVLTDLQYDWRVGEVHLYRSHLATEGATYEILATAKLG